MFLSIARSQIRCNTVKPNRWGEGCIRIELDSPLQSAGSSQRFSTGGKDSDDTIDFRQQVRKRFYQNNASS